MNINDAIIINQLAQKILPTSEGERWFSGLDFESKRKALYAVTTMISQAHPVRQDADAAITESGLKKTLTPCVLLSKGSTKIQLAKIANLPEPEMSNAFKLLVHLLGIADKRRRETKPLDLENHWWHRDLRNSQIVEEIRQRHGGKSK